MTKKYKCKKKVLINVESKKKRKINIFRVINYFLLSLNRITSLFYSYQIMPCVKVGLFFFFILYIIRIIKKCYQRNVVINYSSLIDQCVV